MPAVFSDDFTTDAPIPSWGVGRGRAPILTYSGTGIEVPGADAAHQIIGTSAAAYISPGIPGIGMTLKVTANTGLVADTLIGILFAEFDGEWIPIFSTKAIAANATTPVVVVAGWHENDSGAGPAKYILTDPVVDAWKTSQEDSVSSDGLLPNVYWGTGIPCGIADRVRVSFAVLDADASGSTFDAVMKLYGYGGG